MSEIKEVSFKLPWDLEILLNWCVKYMPEFKGDPSKVAGYFFRKGIEAAYEQSFADHDPLAPETKEALANTQHAALQIEMSGTQRSDPSEPEDDDGWSSPPVPLSFDDAPEV